MQRVQPRKRSKSWLPKCCGSAQKGDNEIDNLDCSKEVHAPVDSSTTQIVDEWDQGMLNVSDPAAPVWLRDTNQWSESEQKQPEVPLLEQVPGYATSPVPGVPPGNPLDLLGGGRSCSVPLPRAFRDEETQPSDRKPRKYTEDFESSTGMDLVRANLQSCMLKHTELPLSDVLQAKVSAVRAMVEATASYRFEHAKQLKHLRDVLTKEQASMWVRLARSKQLREQIAARVQEAVQAEDFNKAEEVYQLQRLAEECIQGFQLDPRQGGSVELSNGSILLGPASDLGLLEGDFTVEFWMRCQDLMKRQPLVTSSLSHPGCFPSVYAKPGGGLELVGEHTHSSRMPFQQKRQWTHVAITWAFDSSENDFKVTIFKDGVQVALGTEILAINKDSELRLGPFSGNLAEFRVWDHARSANEIELSSFRHCGGEESGLVCCLSLRPGRGLSDSALDPQNSLASGHSFSDRGHCEGEITWDGDCPRLLESHAELPMEPAAECPLCAIPYVDGSQYCRECGQKRPLKQAKPSLFQLESDPWTDESLQRAWAWLDGWHETEASHRRSQAEDREVEREQRQVQEQQRKAYIEWQEQQRLKEEQEAKAKQEEEEAAKLLTEIEESKPRASLVWKRLASWTCPFASF